MIQKEKIFEKIIKTGSCGDVSCHSECPFFKKNVCTAWDKPIVKAIKDIRKEKEQIKEKIKNVREKLFNLLSEYEIGNYDNNIHQFYEDVYDIHNELMELAE